MMLDLEEFEAIKETLVEHKGTGDAVDQVTSTFKVLDMMKTIEFLSDQLTSVCVCTSLMMGATCRPCKALNFIWGERESASLPENKIVKPLILV